MDEPIPVPNQHLSTFLAEHADWPDYWANVMPTETDVDAYVTLHTQNPHLLRALLVWLGAPKDVIVETTGITV